MNFLEQRKASKFGEAEVETVHHLGKVEGDILNHPVQDLSEATLLQSGFPCPPSSIKGYRRPLDHPDIRVMNKVVQQILHLARQYPKFLGFVLENPLGFLKKYHILAGKRAIDFLLEGLEPLGDAWHVDWHILNAAPQPTDRERVIIQGAQSVILSPWDGLFPEIENPQFHDVVDYLQKDPHSAYILNLTPKQEDCIFINCLMLHDT